MRLIALCLLALGCGHDQKSTGPGGSKCEPGRCLADLAQVISEHRADVRACYDTGVMVNPAIKDGRIIINFEIDPEGTVSDASQSVQSEQIQDPEVISCTVAIVKGIKFAKSAAGKKTRGYHAFEFGKRAKRE